MITRRAKFELAKARERAHILLGLVIAVTNLDEVVRMIRGSAIAGRGARERLLARDWPIARDRARTSRWSRRSNRRQADRRTACPRRRSARSSNCACTA